jgi:glycosyltransferase involved in cell wall biosynthesis
MFHQGGDLYGSDKIFLLVSKHLENGHNVRVFLAEDGPLINELKANGVTSVQIVDLAVLRRVNFTTIKNVLAYIWAAIRSTVRIRQIISKSDADIVYVNTLAVLVPLVSSLGLRVKTIHHIHEIQSKPRMLASLLYSVVGCLSDRVICVSGPVREHFRKFSKCGQRKTVVVNNGIPDEVVGEEEKASLQLLLAQKFEHPKRPIIAYVARLHTWKGQLDFLDVVELLIKKHRVDFNVAFFGDVFPGYEPIRSQIEKRILEKGIGGQVVLFGFRSDAAALFDISAISIMGSIEPDPFPTVVLESLRQGTPVIGYGHGGITEMIVDGDCGVLVEPGDKAQMAEKIAHLLVNEEALRKMSMNARLRYEGVYSIEGFNSRIDAVLAEYY